MHIIKKDSRYMLFDNYGLLVRDVFVRRIF